MVEVFGRPHFRLIPEQAVHHLKTILIRTSDAPYDPGRVAPSRRRAGCPRTRLGLVETGQQRTRLRDIRGEAIEAYRDRRRISGLGRAIDQLFLLRTNRPRNAGLSTTSVGGCSNALTDLLRVRLQFRIGIACKYRGSTPPAFLGRPRDFLFTETDFLELTEYRRCTAPL